MSLGSVQRQDDGFGDPTGFPLANNFIDERPDELGGIGRV